MHLMTLLIVTNFYNSVFDHSLNCGYFGLSKIKWFLDLFNLLVLSVKFLRLVYSYGFYHCYDFKVFFYVFIILGLKHSRLTVFISYEEIISKIRHTYNKYQGLSLS